MPKSTPDANAQLSLVSPPAGEVLPRDELVLQWLDAEGDGVALVRHGPLAAACARAKARRLVTFQREGSPPPASEPGVSVTTLLVSHDKLPAKLDAVRDAIAALDLNDEPALIDGTTELLAAQAVAGCWLIAQGDLSHEALQHLGSTSDRLEDFLVGYQASLDAEDDEAEDSAAGDEDEDLEDESEDEPSSDSEEERAAADDDEQTDERERLTDDELDDDDEDDDDEDEPESRTEELLALEAPETHARVPLERLQGLRPRQAQLVGAVLGGAIGDAMGHPTEFLAMEGIRDRYGAKGVTKFELYWDRGGSRFAPYTDDTQMAEAVLRALLEARTNGADLDGTMKAMAVRFIQWSRSPQGGHRAPGNACMSGCRALSSGTHWSQAGGATAGGCGSVMRAYPFGLVFANDLAKAEHWAVEHSKLTHRDPIALAACAAMAVGVALALRGETVRVITSEMVAAACRYSPSTAAMMATAIDEARKGVGPEVTLDRLRAWAAHEAIASCVYLFERHPDDARAAILEGANTPGDSDSIATLAGALIGARAGVGGLPDEWVADVERASELAALALSI